MAEETALKLQNEPIRSIFCSPMIRTLQTATFIANKLNIKIRIEYGLLEWMGEDHDVQPLTIDELAQQFPVDTSYVSSISLPQKESKQMMYQRAKYISQHLADKYLSDYGQIVVVTHAALVIGMTRALVGNNDYHVRCGVCSIGKFQRNQDRSYVHQWNGHAEHLSCGEQWHFEFKGDQKRRLKREQQQQQLEQQSLGAKSEADA